MACRAAFSDACQFPASPSEHAPAVAKRAGKGHIIIQSDMAAVLAAWAVEQVDPSQPPGAAVGVQDDFTIQVCQRWSQWRVEVGHLRTKEQTKDVTAWWKPPDFETAEKVLVTGRHQWP
jgi:hypothetical protein